MNKKKKNLVAHYELKGDVLSESWWDDPAPEDKSPKRSSRPQLQNEPYISLTEKDILKHHKLKELEREDLMNYNIQLSKDFKALKVWMTIKTYGYHKIKQAIKNDIKMASYAYDKVCQDSRFEPINNPELSILCFKYKGETKGLNNSSLNKKITDMIEEDGRVFLSGTIINNENVLRINCINHRRKKSDIDFLFEVLKEIGKKAEKELTLN